MTRAVTQISLVCVLLTALIFLNLAGILQKPLDVARETVGILNWPVAKGFERIYDFGKAVVHLKNIVTENEILTRQVQELSQDVALSEKARLENRVLREALGFQAEAKFDLVAAEVITWDILNVSQTITINRGGRDGIEVGSPVVVGRGILVGVVSSVSDGTAQAELITSSDITVNAQVLPSGAIGIVKGEHGLGLLFDLVSQNEIISPGDRVVTSGLGGKFPKNLLIGQIDKVVSTDPELFQKASIVPSADLRNNQTVFVIKK